MTTKEERKAQAIKLMKKLNIYNPYIKGFEEENNVCYFERYAGFWAFQDEELLEKINEIENKYGCTVYAVTHEFAEFGELYNFLIVPKNKIEWKELLIGDKNTKYVFAYVWNKTYDDCSEFGTIVINALYGGLKRIG